MGDHGYGLKSKPHNNHQDSGPCTKLTRSQFSMSGVLLLIAFHILYVGVEPSCIRSVESLLFCVIAIPKGI